MTYLEPAVDCRCGAPLLKSDYSPFTDSYACWRCDGGMSAREFAQKLPSQMPIRDVLIWVDHS